MAYLIVFLGAGIGGSLRHFVNVAAMRLGLPTYGGTLLINVSGSIVIGLIAGTFALRGHLPRHVLLFLTTGIMGGYTTFSTFSLETVLLAERGELATAAGYVALSVALSVLGTVAALWLVRTVVGPA